MYDCSHNHISFVGILKNKSFLQNSILMFIFNGYVIETGSVPTWWIKIMLYAFYHILFHRKLHLKHKYAAEYIQVPLRCFRMCFCILSRCRQKTLSNAYYCNILNWKVPRKLRKTHMATFYVLHLQKLIIYMWLINR